MHSRFRRHSWKNKFRNALRGLQRALRTQSSFAVHLLIACIAVIAAAILRVNMVEWGLLVAAIGMVMVAEISTQRSSHYRVRSIHSFTHDYEMHWTCQCGGSFAAGLRL